MVKIKRGLDIPITGAPSQQISDMSSVRSVAILGADYMGMKPTMKVAEGDRVVKGQPLFADKKKSPSDFYRTCHRSSEGN